MSEIRANLLNYLIQHCTQDDTIQRKLFLDRFSALHSVDRRMADIALEDLRHFGLAETTPLTVTLTALARRLSH